MEKREAVTQFLTSPRGMFIISQALFVAIETMKKVEPEYKRELSNIADMEYLLDELFPMYKTVLMIKEGIENDRP